MPENDKSGSSSFRFESPRQERIHRRLLLVGQGPASFYRDACRLMGEESPLASTTHLVAHLLREIESGLRDVLETVADQSVRLKKGAKGEERHRDEIRAVLKGLDIAETDQIAQAWLRLPGSENEYGLAARAHRDALSAPRPLNAEFREFWNEIEAILDGVLEKFEEHYVAWHKQIDLLALKASPTQTDAEILRLHFPNNLVAFGQFFNQLSNPAWLQPLFAEGLFNHPPEPDYDEEKGTVGLWNWPQSRYLARMAASASGEVLNIILAIPDTKNTRVHLDFAEAAISMPADLAAQLVPKMKSWVETEYLLLLPKKLGEVMEKLAQGGQIGPALELARSLLGLKQDPKPPVPLDEARKIFAHREPRARFDVWEYGEILKKNFPWVLEAAGEQSLSLLCDLLEEAVRLSIPTGEKPSANDLSPSWRPAIEDHAQNSSHDVALLTSSRKGSDASGGRD